MTAPSSSRSRAATLHVDLGEGLKADVLTAAAAAGSTPSDWVRAALRRAAEEQSVNGAGPGSKSSDKVVPLRPLSGPATPSTPGTRPIAVHLAADDVALIDDVVAASKFRTRPAAVRFVLRAVLADGEGGDALAALAELPRAVPALAAANIELRVATRRLESHASHDASALCQLVEQHLHSASKVLAALRPLLSARRA